MNGVQLIFTKYNGKTSSELTVTNQKQDNFCLNKSETRDFPLNWFIHSCFVKDNCTTSQGKNLCNE